MIRNQPPIRRSREIGAGAKSAIKTVFYGIMEEKDRNK
jgi:hypothetical protein